MQRFVREEERIKNSFLMVTQNDEMHGQIKNLPKDYDTLKKVFGRNNIAAGKICIYMGGLKMTKY